MACHGAEESQEPLRGRRADIWSARAREVTDRAWTRKLPRGCFDRAEAGAERNSGVAPRWPERAMNWMTAFPRAQPVLFKPVEYAQRPRSAAGRNGAPLARHLSGGCGAEPRE